jgi:TonB family protein
MSPHRIAGLLAVLTVLPIVPVFAQEAAQDAGPVFIARDVEPTLKNSKDVRRLMRRVYPPAYRDSGLDVTTIMWVYVEPDGTVGASEVLKSAGYDAFDRAAGQLAEAMLFTPALREGEPLGVWINQAFHFKSGEGGKLLEGPGLLMEEPEEPEEAEEPPPTP